MIKHGSKAMYDKEQGSIKGFLRPEIKEKSITNLGIKVDGQIA